MQTRCLLHAGPYFANYDLDIEGSWGKAFCGADRIKLSDAEQTRRAQAVENKEGTAKDLGCHGVSPVKKHLEYVDYNNIWVMPMSHALIYGAVRHFWKLLLTPPPSGKYCFGCHNINGRNLHWLNL